MQIPAGPSALTTGWLTEALRHSKTVSEARVTSFESAPLGGPGGITGQLARVNLRYDFDESDAPRCIIAKFSIEDPVARSSIKNIGHYEREVRFYQHVADKVDLRTPRCYYSDIDLETYAHVLLLEDMAPARNPDWAEGSSLEEIEIAIREIAKFHAIWWESPQLDAMEWLSPFSEDFRRWFQEQCERRLDHFLTKVAKQLPEGVDQIARQAVEKNPRMMIHMAQPPRTIIHNDYKSDNLFFASDHGGVPFAVVDWQLVTAGRAVYDAAYFLCAGVTPEVLKSKDLDFLQIYHTVLTDGGVRGYSFEDCLFDYRASLLTRLTRLIFILGNDGLEPEQERHYMQILLPRCGAAILDVDAGQVLSAFA